MKTQQTEHTPLTAPEHKWRFDPDNHGRSFNDGYGLRIEREEGALHEPSIPVFIEAKNGDFDTAAIYAELIVHTMNVHNDLVNAIQGFIDWFDSPDRRWDNPQKPPKTPVVIALREALENAKGGF